MLQDPATRLILASQSPSRRALMASTGLAFETVPAWIDEAAIKASAQAEGWQPDECAVHLAELKAARVARTHPDALVIGADQLLVCNGVWFEKPQTVSEARSHLTLLSGQVHDLVTAIVCFQGGHRVWHDIATPRLRMRQLSEALIDWYIASEGDAVTTTVGAYRIEGLGLHLFDQITGAHSAILGMQMLPLLGYLRQARILEPGRR